jgi:hypothetical protein
MFNQYPALVFLIVCLTNIFLPRFRLSLSPNLFHVDRSSCVESKTVTNLICKLWLIVSIFVTAQRLKVQSSYVDIMIWYICNAHYLYSLFHVKNLFIQVINKESTLVLYCFHCHWKNLPVLFLWTLVHTAATKQQLIDPHIIYVSARCLCKLFLSS